MNGYGTVSLHSSLIILRSWLIESCISFDDYKTDNDDKYVEISINDDCFDEMIAKNEDIFNFEGLINSLFNSKKEIFKKFDNSCGKIDGVIVD